MCSIAGAGTGMSVKGAQAAPGAEGRLSRDALEGKGPQRRPQKRLDRRLEGVAKAVGGGYCRLQMPLKLALVVRKTVAGRPGRGGGVYLPRFQCIPVVVPLSHTKYASPPAAWGTQCEQFIPQNPNGCAPPEVPTGTLTPPSGQPRPPSPVAGQRRPSLQSPLACGPLFKAQACP